MTNIYQNLGGSYALSIPIISPIIQHMLAAGSRCRRMDAHDVRGEEWPRGDREERRNRETIVPKNGKSLIVRDYPVD